MKKFKQWLRHKRAMAHSRMPELRIIFISQAVGWLLGSAGSTILLHAYDAPAIVFKGLTCVIALVVIIHNARKYHEEERERRRAIEEMMVGFDEVFDSIRKHINVVNDGEDESGR